MGAALFLYYARKGTGASFMIGIDGDRNVTTPTNSVLEDGVYLISQEAGGPQIARFMVVDGMVGQVTSTTAPEDVVRFVLRLVPQTRAEKLDDFLSRLETTLDMAEGNSCRECGKVHTFQSKGVDPRGAINAYNAWIAYFAECDVILMLQHIVFDQDERNDAGYRTVQEVLGHIARINALMAHPIAVPAAEEEAPAQVP